MLRIFILMISLNLSGFSISQKDLASMRQQDIQEMRVDKDFDSKYDRKLRRLLRTYPMALKAKELIDEYEADLANIDKNRKRKKYGRNAHKDLKEQFSFNIRDLYTSEGKMLMKLIHRETGMTVSEIIEKYRGGGSENLYTTMAKLWGQDLDAKFDPNVDDDWITDLIIQDIIDGNIEFNTEMRIMTKKDYKESMKEYRENRKEIRKRYRKIDKKKEKDK